MVKSNKSLYYLSPIVQFIRKSSFSSILLFAAALLALIIANSPWNETMHLILDKKIGFTMGDFKLYKPLILWINDGLMSIFFFVVGLELKREIMAGELSNPANVMMPIIGAVGGMIIPAFIYIGFNLTGTDEAMNGWGIPMATDIAFALGVLYLLGPKVPIQLKVFLTALAIIDDLGAVLVVALFYTTDVSLVNLGIGAAILGLMFMLNKFGVRNVLIYGFLGIGGVWLAFLLSGVHATIAAVLAAFAIPANRAIDKESFVEDMQRLTGMFKQANKSEKEKFLLSADEENIIGEIQRISNDSISPLQRLEHSMHPLVVYVVMPVFALANAGIVVTADWFDTLLSPISLGVVVGLIFGKVLGIFGLSMLGLKLGIFDLPQNLNKTMIFGVSLLAGIGFTMSLFINSLAFETELCVTQAKMGVLFASLTAGIFGYFVLRKSISKIP